MATNGVPVAYTSNAINSYPTIGGVNRTHDANGNLTNDGTYTYTYNYRDQLIGVLRNADQFIMSTSTYDALDRRVTREFWVAQAGAYRTLRYVNSGWQVVAEYTPGIPEVLFNRTAYGNGIDEPIVLEVLDINDVNGNQIVNEYLPYFYHRDTLGSITHMTDAAGTIVERYECTPFGKTTFYTGTGPDGLWNTADDQVLLFSRIENDVIFQGRQLDQESGLYYFRTRHYAPDEGRFLQRDGPGDWYDPAEFGSGYNSFGSRPFSCVDPLGFAQMKGTPIFGPSSAWPGWIPGLPNPGLTPNTPCGTGLTSMGFTGRNKAPVTSTVLYTITEEITYQGPWICVDSGSISRTVGNTTRVFNWSLWERDVEAIFRVYITYSITDQWGTTRTVQDELYAAYEWKGKERTYMYSVLTYDSDNNLISASNTENGPCYCPPYTIKKVFP